MRKPPADIKCDYGASKTVTAFIIFDTEMDNPGWKFCFTWAAIFVWHFRSMNVIVSKNAGNHKLSSIIWSNLMANFNWLKAIFSVCKFELKFIENSQEFGARRIYVSIYDRIMQM